MDRGESLLRLDGDFEVDAGGFVILFVCHTLIAVVWWLGLKKGGSLRSVPDTRRNGGRVSASGPPPHFSGEKCIPDRSFDPGKRTRR